MNRHASRAALITKIRAARDDGADVLGVAAALHDAAGNPVQIELVWPGDQTGPEAIYLMPSQGSLDVPVFHGTPSVSNPITVEDDFTIPLEIKACAAGQTDTEAEVRVEAIVNAVATVVAVDPTLGGVAGLFWATASAYDGPGPGRSTTGVQAYARLTLSCKSRS